MPSIVADLHHSLRAIRRSPGFAAAVALTLGLGIGATTTLVSVVDTLMFRPPVGVVEPERVVRPFLHSSSPQFGSWTGSTLTYPDFVDLRDRVPSFASVAAFRTESMSLGRGAGARHAEVLAVSGHYFSLLGATTAVGRPILAEDDDPDAPRPVAVLSDRFWRRQFAGDRSIIGKPVALNGKEYTIVGVTPRAFTGVELSAPDLWLPLSNIQERKSMQERNWYSLSTVARLKPGATWVGAAAQATAAIAAGRIDPTTMNGFQDAIMGPVQAARGPERGSTDRVAVWLAGVSLLVLLVACANVANLLLARGLGRARELAIRKALGAGMGRIVRQLALENIMLAVLGGGVAMIFSVWVGGLVRGLLLPNGVAELYSLDLRVLAVTGCATLSAAALAGLLPAWRVARGDLIQVLKDGSTGAGYRRSRIRTGLVVVQVTFSVLLVVGAGLFVRSLRNAENIDLGYDVPRIAMVWANLTEVGFTPAQSKAAFETMREIALRHPGVESSSLTSGEPFGWNFASSVRLPGQDSVSQMPSGGPYIQSVSPEYFTTLGLEIRRGRGLQAADRGGVAVIGASMARHFWPGINPVGQCFFRGDSKTCTEIVGVAEDGRRNDVIETDQAMFYVPLSESASENHFAMFIRARGDARTIAGEIQRLLQSSVPGLPYVRVEPLSDTLAPQYASWRLGATVFSFFSLLALALASIGIYGVLAYAVRARRHELGIRAALGAAPERLRGMILREGLGLAGIGLGLGLLLAGIGGRALGALLYGVTSWDPGVLSMSALVLGGVAVIASLVPARRATRVDPMVALRSE